MEPGPGGRSPDLAPREVPLETRGGVDKGVTLIKRERVGQGQGLCCLATEDSGRAVSFFLLGRGWRWPIEEGPFVKGNIGI